MTLRWPPFAPASAAEQDADAVRLDLAAYG